MALLLTKLLTAWRSKEIAAILSAISIIMSASYQFDIQPIIEAIEGIGVAVYPVLVALGITAVGVDNANK